LQTNTNFISDYRSLAVHVFILFPITIMHGRLINVLGKTDLYVKEVLKVIA